MLLRTIAGLLYAACCSLIALFAFIVALPNAANAGIALAAVVVGVGAAWMAVLTPLALVDEIARGWRKS
jgi:hypothetical protein